MMAVFQSWEKNIGFNPATWQPEADNANFEREIAARKVARLKNNPATPGNPSQQPGNHQAWTTLDIFENQPFTRAGI